METLTLPQLQQALIAISRAIVANEPRLTEIDTIIGDGDHGTGMREGFSALEALLTTTEYPDIFELFRASGLQLVKVMGGASGVLFGTLFTAGHAVIQDKTALTADDLIAFFDEGATAIMRRGRSGPGDKTMLDALLPAIDAMCARRQTTAEVQDVLAAAVEGALNGVKASEQMLPRTGRSKNFREQALGWPDPGAVSVSILFKALYNSISNT